MRNIQNIIIVLGIMLCAPYSGFTQDSTVNVSNDIEGVKKLFKIGRQYRHSDYDQALYFSEKSKQLAMEIGYDEGIAKAHYLIAYVSYLADQPTKAINNYLSCLKLSMENDMINWALLTLENMAKIYYDFSDYHNAYQYYLEAATLIQDSASVSINLYNQGSALYKLQRYDSALQLFETSAELFGNQDNIENFQEVELAMGSIYREKGAPAVSKRIYQKLILVGNNSEIKTMAKNNLGNLYLKEERFDSALFYLESVVERTESIPTNILMTSLNNIGEIYLSMGLLDSSEKYFTMSEIEATGDISRIEHLRALEGLIAIYERQSKIEKARLYEKKLISELKPLVDIFNQLQTLNIQYQLWHVKFNHERREREEQIAFNLLRNRIIITLLIVVAILGYLLYSKHYRKGKRLRHAIDSIYHNQMQMQQQIGKTIGSMNAPNPEIYHLK